MERFKRTLKIRMTLLAALEIAACGLMAYGFAGEAAKALDDFMLGFQAGISSGLAVAALILLVWYGRILLDPRRLRLQYNKEMDERMRAINAKAGMPILWVTSVLMILAGMAGGYWHPMIFYALIPAGALQLAASITVIAVYSKIM